MNYTLKFRRELLLNAVGCFILIFYAGITLAQDSNTISLEQCYQLALTNYPLAKQRGLIDKTKGYTIDNIAKGLIPQFSVNGTGTYQSDVTKITVPGLQSPAIPKDQYNIHGEVSQTLSDFGINRQRREISRTEADILQENLNIELFQLKDRVNQMFFGVVLIDGQLEQYDLSKKDLQTGIAKVRAAIDNGTGFKSSLNKLNAELLKTDEHSIDLKASRKAFIEMFGLFINRKIDDHTVFAKPNTPVLTDSLNRPELRSYDLQVKSYAEQQRLTRIGNYPQLSAFFQGGIGDPSPVNFLKPGLSSYYITGLRLSWNLSGLYTSRKDKMINKNNQEIVQLQRNTFLLNTKLTLRQQDADIARYQQLIQSDDEIISLRASVKHSSEVQLQNGVISANDFLLDIDAENLARQDRVLHQVQLLMAQYNHKTTSGN